MSSLLATIEQENQSIAVTNDPTHHCTLKPQFMLKMGEHKLGEHKLGEHYLGVSA